MVKGDIMKRNQNTSRFIWSIIVIIIVAFGAWYYWLTVGQFAPKTVLFLPKGFVKVEEIKEKEAVDVIFFEKYCSIVDEAGNRVGGGMVSDTSFIVSYHGEYYINTQGIFDPQ